MIRPIRPIGRTLWFVAGAGAGVYAVNRAKRAAEAFTPEGLADRMAGWSLGAHLFGQEVRAGMEEKETELRGRMGLALHGQTAGNELEQPKQIGHPDRVERGND
jgi:hypothetical protein